MRRMHALLSLVLLSLIVAPAMADTLTATFNIPGIPRPTWTSPWATMELTLQGNSIAVHVTSSGLPIFDVLFYGAAPGPDNSATGLPPNYVLSGAYTPEFGKRPGTDFALEVALLSQYYPSGPAVTDLSFVLSRTGAYGSVYDLVGLSTGPLPPFDPSVAPPVHFAIGFVPPTGGLAYTAGALAPTVPEPGSIVLVGMGVFGVIGVTRKQIR